MCLHLWLGLHGTASSSPPSAHGGRNYRHSPRGHCGVLSGPPSGPRLSFPQLMGSWCLQAPGSSIGIAFGLDELLPSPGSTCIQKLVHVGTQRPRPLPEGGAAVKGQPSMRAHRGTDGAMAWVSSQLHFCPCPICPHFLAVVVPENTTPELPACKSPSQGLLPGRPQLRWRPRSTARVEQLAENSPFSRVGRD